MRQLWPQTPRSYLSDVSWQPEYRWPTRVFLNKSLSYRGGRGRIGSVRVGRRADVIWVWLASVGARVR